MVITDTAAWVQSQSRSIVDFISAPTANSSSLPPYVQIGAAAAVTMGLGYYLSKGVSSGSSSGSSGSYSFSGVTYSGNVKPLVDPMNQSRVLPVLVPAMADQGIKGSLDELCKNETVKKAVLDDMIAVGKKAGLFSFEQVRDIYLSAEQFSVENDLLTPTLKSKRPKLKAHYAKELERMYSKLS